jgi:hypothetical protein
MNSLIKITRSKMRRGDEEVRDWAFKRALVPNANALSNWLNLFSRVFRSETKDENLLFNFLTYFIQ